MQPKPTLSDTKRINDLTLELLRAGVAEQLFNMIVDILGYERR